MKAYYPLKKSQPINLVQPLVKYLDTAQSPQIGLLFRDGLSSINQLRNKATALQLSSNPQSEQIDKYITVIQMYVKFALLIAKHFNWNPNYGIIVQDLNIVWYDSFNSNMNFMKNQIHYDIFCCFYNLGILNFHKSCNYSVQDFMNSRKQAMKCAKYSYYYFNQMRTYYYQGFVNTGFGDTNYSHLQMLQSLSLGIIYKSLFNNIKQDQFKFGIDKVAAIASLAQQNFYKAYQIGTQFFMKSSSINNTIKSQLLSFSYVQSLYHDVISNSKYAKYFENQMDNNKDNIIYLIAYQRRTLRLLNLGLGNQSVSHLLDQRSQQKKDLLKIKPQLQKSLQKNITRNKQIYKKQQISQEKIPPPAQPPKQYLVKAKQPQKIAISYQGSIAGLFSKLIDNQSKSFMNQLKQFSKNRIIGLQSAYNRLQKNIQIIYNDNFVNYYINLQNNTKNKQTIPQNLKKKIQLIRSNGGKQKIDMEIKIIKVNAQQIGNKFKQLKQFIHDQQVFDNNKRSTYQDRWRRPPSSVVNRSYVNQIQLYQKKAEQALATNMKLLQKYQRLLKYISVVDSNQQTIMSIIPKIELSKFIQDNKKDFDLLKQGIASIKSKTQNIQSLTNDIRKFFSQCDFNDLANKYFKDAVDNRQVVLDKIFNKGYKLIQQFNQKAKLLEKQAQNIGQISMNLNKKNKGDQNIKKQFEVVMSRFAQIASIFNQLAQGTIFYTKLNDILAKIYSDLQGFIAARKIQANQLQNLINKGGYHGGPNLPTMYPNQNNNQQNYGFYIPPPQQQNQGYYNQVPSGFQQQNSSNLGDMLKNLMSSKPQFDTNIFGISGNVYQSKYK